MDREAQYRPWHHTWDDSKIELSIEALEKIAFQFPACADERVQLLWAVDSLKGVSSTTRRWGR